MDELNLISLTTTIAFRYHDGYIPGIVFNEMKSRNLLIKGKKKIYKKNLFKQEKHDKVERNIA